MVIFCLYFPDRYIQSALNNGNNNIILQIADIWHFPLHNHLTTVGLSDTAKYIVQYEESQSTNSGLLADPGSP
jgi:hypothetical protein